MCLCVCVHFSYFQDVLQSPLLPSGLKEIVLQKKGAWSTTDADCGIDIISVISNESMVKEENDTPVPAKERFSTLHNSNMYGNFEPVVSSDDENCIDLTSNE